MPELYRGYFTELDKPLFHHAADTELELMMQDDGVNTPTSPLVREDTALGDSVFAIFEEILTEREQWIVNAWVFERLGVRTIGAQLSLSKSQVHRILQGALRKLAVQLGDSPAVASWLQASSSIETEN
jgi:DNA-directed RNA polymerase specialized sigma subunit